MINSIEVVNSIVDKMGWLQVLQQHMISKDRNRIVFGDNDFRDVDAILQAAIKFPR